jgi:ABC-type bacteriocin/lantibiotic exporter with double-glycine peptidase domain
MVEVLFDCFFILKQVDRRKYVLILFVQLVLALLDLAGVAILGILGALAIRGVQSQQPGDRTLQVLEFLGIVDLSFQQQVATLGVAAMVFLVLRTIFSMFMTRKILHFLSSKSTVISTELLSRMLANENAKMLNENAVKMQYILGPGVSAIAVGILGTAATMLGDLSVLVVITMGVLLFNFEIALLSLFIFGFVGFMLYFKLHLRAEQIGNNLATLHISADQMVSEIMFGSREIYVRNRRFHYVEQLRLLKEKSSYFYAESSFLPNIGKYVIEITIIVGAVMVSVFQFLRQDAAQAIAGLAIFVIAGTRIAPALLRLQQGFITIKSHIGVASPTLEAINRTAKLAELEPVVQGLDILHDGFLPKIEISNLKFNYAADSNFSLEIDELTIGPGETIAIVGPSGAGKSTLVDLLLGIISPDSGTIKISTCPPESAVAKWPGAIGFVPQSIYISSSTILENVAFGFQPEEIDLQRVNESLQDAQIFDFVSALPGGVHAQVGDRGSRLSGGQRQRLGIARALYTQPKLLILDEATSALDGLVEKEVSLAIGNIKSKMSVVIIAHRLSTVQLADTIIYIKDGKIQAMGSFDELRLKVPDFDEQAKLSGL